MNPIDLSSLAGLTLTDDIQLIEQIGAGGMGVVYRGVQKSLNRAVCVKFMQSDLVSSLEWQHRFRREAQVLAGIRHKHLARVYAVGFYQSVYPYLVMELLNGSTLNKLIKQQGTLPWRTAAEHHTDLRRNVLRS